MKILYATPAYEPAWRLGGVVRSVSQLCRGMADLGHKVTVFTTNMDSVGTMDVPLDQPVDLGGVEVYYFKTDLGGSFAYSRAFKEACHLRLKDFDIVNLHSVWNYPALPASAEAGRQGVPYVYHTHGGLTHYSTSIRHIRKWIYFKLFNQKIMSRASAIRYTAQMEREQTQHLAVKTPSFVIPNPLDAREFAHGPEKSAARKQWGIAPTGPVVLYLGRLDSRKAPDLLLKGFALAAGRRPGATLVFAGPDFGEEQNLKKLALTLGISPQVLFTGYVPPESRNALFASVDLLALTSPGENFGNAAAEAMLAGVPVLVSEHVGISREVAADGAGVVTSLEVGAISQALADMLSNTDRLAAMGRVAAIAARRRYEVKVVARQMSTAYEDILTGRRSPELSWSDAQAVSVLPPDR
jgi:glycosyltransferase involved in cell wall biosynthesis